MCTYVWLHTDTYVHKLSLLRFPVFSPALHSHNLMLWTYLQLLLAAKFTFPMSHSSSPHSRNYLLNTYNVIGMFFSFQRFRYVPIQLPLLTLACDKIMRSAALAADTNGSALYFLGIFNGNPLSRVDYVWI